MDTLLLTTTEAANALGIGRSKVYELLQTGQLPSVLTEHGVGRVAATPPRA